MAKDQIQRVPGERLRPGLASTMDQGGARKNQADKAGDLSGTMFNGGKNPTATPRGGKVGSKTMYQ
ncbi:MAG: hypothetical protein WCE44_02665 [Candidatus Velthaea sp.]